MQRRIGSFQPDETSMNSLRQRMGNSRYNRNGSGFPSDAYPNTPPSFQPDEGSIGALDRNMRGNVESFDDIIKRLNNNNIPPQLRQVPYVVQLASAVDVPKLLIPENKNRMSFIVSFIDTAFATPALTLITYGPPPMAGIGIPLLSVVPYGESNGTISIDDIYISPFNNGNNLISYPVTIVAYEGTLAIESANNRNSR